MMPVFILFILFVFYYIRNKADLATIFFTFRRNVPLKNFFVPACMPSLTGELKTIFCYLEIWYCKSNILDDMEGIKNRALCIKYVAWLDF